MEEHNFVKLAKVQRAQQTNYNGGLDIHPFGGYNKNFEIYCIGIPSYHVPKYRIFGSAY